MSTPTPPGFFHWRDALVFVASLAVSVALVWGLVALLRHYWASLPLGLALAVCILLAVAAIGMPIYSLWRWSERYLARIAANRRRMD